MSTVSIEPPPLARCNLCGHPMRRATGSPSTGNVIIGIFLIVLGLGLTATCWLAVAGVPIAIVGIVVCSIGRKGLKCMGCGQFVPRS